MSDRSSDAVDVEDVEKQPKTESGPNNSSHIISHRSGDRGHDSTPAIAPTEPGGYLRRFERQLTKYNLETRGIQRVTPEERHALTWKSHGQAFFLWVSINLAAVNITLGMLAPAIFELSFKDASLCAVFGSLVGSIAVAYIATWGPVSGNRSMVWMDYCSSVWSSNKLFLDFRSVYHGLVAK